HFIRYGYGLAKARVLRFEAARLGTGTKHLMISPVLKDPDDTNSPLQKREKGPAKAYIVMKYKPDAGRAYGWSVDSRKGVTAKEANEIATFLSQGAYAHLREKEVEPRNTFLKVLDKNRVIAVEFRRNMFEEQTIFETG